MQIYTCIVHPRYHSTLQEAIFGHGNTYGGADMLLKIVEDRPEFSFVQVSAVVIVVLVEEGPQKFLQAYHNLLWQYKATLDGKYTICGFPQETMPHQQCVSTA